MVESRRPAVPWIPMLGGLAGCGEHQLAPWTEDDGADDVGESDGASQGSTGSSDSADDDGGNEPFFIVEVGVGVGQTIPLTFSQPVGSLAGVDPQAFRISMANTWYYDAVYQVSYYEDMAYLDYDPALNPFVIESLTPGADVHQVVLRLDRAIPGYICEYIEMNNGPNYAEQMSEMTLLLHHAAGDIPIHSVDDVPLADFGADWVLEGKLSDSVPEYGFPNLGTRVDVPCP